MSPTIMRIKGNTINRDDLDTVVMGLELACGGRRIVVTETYELTVTDDRQVAALKALFGENGGGLPEQGIEKKSSKRPWNNPLPAKEQKTTRTYTVESSGAVVSAVEFKRALSRGEIAEGTIIQTAAGKRLVVSGQTMKPVMAVQLKEGEND